MNLLKCKIFHFIYSKQFLKLSKIKANARFRRIAEQREKEVRETEFVAKNRDEKLTKTCQLQRFLKHLVDNGTMLAENRHWRKFLTDYLKKVDDQIHLE